MSRFGKKLDAIGRTSQRRFLSRHAIGIPATGDESQAFPTEAVPMNQAWRIYDELLSDDRIGLAEEPDLIEKQLRKFSQRQTFSTNVWTDAYLAAFAVAADFEMVTFDKGFAQFKNLRRTILS